MTINPIASAAHTHVGHVRQQNEDALLDMPDAGLWAVADGMGGHACGDVASQAVVDALHTLGALYRGRTLLRAIPDAMRRVNQQLQQQGALLPGLDGIIGTTVVILVLEADNYHCYWAGDSRLYLLRDNELTCLTRDHATTIGGAGSRGALTRAVGAHSTLDLELVHGHLYEDDTFLLCSDGLTNVLPDHRIAHFLQPPAPAPGEACHGLVEAVLAGGAPDNVSCVIVSVHSS